MSKNVAVQGVPVKKKGLRKPSWLSSFIDKLTNIAKFNIVVSNQFEGKEEQNYLTVNAGKGYEKLVISQYAMEEAHKQSGVKVPLYVDVEGQSFVNSSLLWTITNGKLSIYKES